MWSCSLTTELPETGAPKNSTTAGGGAASECESPSDCPGEEGPCAARICENNLCGQTYWGAEYATASQLEGDCLRQICNGAGDVTTEDDDNDPFDDGNPCTIDSCVAGVVVSENARESTACNAGDICNGKGVCVQCVASESCVTLAMCTQGECICDDGQCVLLHCINSVFDPGLGETDLDCGGSDCNPCLVGETCGGDADCVSGVCDAMKQCAAPSCSDGVHNGNETDVDCGGPTCTACAAGMNCGAHAHCTSGVCTSGTCAAPSCTDGVHNGDETDIDCGGPTCSAGCVQGKKCNTNGDCASILVCNDGTCSLKIIASSGSIPGREF